MERIQIVETYPPDGVTIQTDKGEVAAGGNIEIVRQLTNPADEIFGSPYFRRVGCEMDPNNCPALSPFPSNSITIYFCEAESPTTQAIRRGTDCSKIPIHTPDVG